VEGGGEGASFPQLRSREGGPRDGGSGCGISAWVVRKGVCFQAAMECTCAGYW
jgi:hypothetical protein